MVALPFPIDRPWTIEDLETMPDDGQRYELLQGELIVSPSPGKSHQRIIGQLYVSLDAAAKRAGLGEAVIAPMDVVLSRNDLVQPDLFYIRDEQSEQYGDQQFVGAPAFVIEIVSPSSGSYDRGRKSALYMNAGVEEYWIVEPKQERVLIHTSTDYDAQNAMPRIVTSGILTSIVIPEFAVDLAALFAI